MLVNYFFIIIVFSFTYGIASRFGSQIIEPNNCGKPAQSWVDYLYFSVVTATTLGYGDFIPASHTVLVKFLSMFEVSFGPAFLFAAISLRMK